MHLIYLKCKYIRFAFIVLRGVSSLGLTCKIAVVSIVVLDFAAICSWDLAHRVLLQQFYSLYYVRFSSWLKYIFAIFDAAYACDPFWRRGLHRLIFVDWVCRRELNYWRRDPIVSVWSFACACGVGAEYFNWCAVYFLNEKGSTLLLWLESLFCEELAFARLEYEYNLLLLFLVIKRIAVIHNFY